MLKLNAAAPSVRQPDVTKFRVQLTERAEEDLIDIHSAIAKLNPQSADRILMQIDGRLNALADMPERGFRRPHIREDLRIVVEGDYLIFYRIDGASVQIVRIVYARRDLLKLEFN